MSHRSPDRRTPATLAAALGAALALTACATPSGAGPASPEGPPWSLVALRGQALPVQPLARVPLIELRAGRVSGTTGCNRVTGAYTLSGPALRFGSTAGTRMACADGMETERALLDAMGQVASWRLRDGQLEWLDAGGQPLARWASNLRRYHCGDGSTVLVRYEGSGMAASARLALAGREYAMRSAPAASGARYVVEQGRSPDMSMEWRTRGAEGTLLEAPLSDSRTPADLRAFATCREP